MTNPHELTTRADDGARTQGERGSGGEDAAAPAPSAMPPSIGRYVVIEQAGKGGMGRVFRAYDPKLEREVALKVLLSDAIDASTHARMLREARAMAKLGHPNVVAVYDVEPGPSGGLVLAMEYVRGKTLSAWLDERRRTWSETVEMFRSAGQGLAAAHDADVLHRDFKPTNVLVGEDGRARVTDFGLAKLDPQASVSGSTSSGAVVVSDASDQPLTIPGMVMGTPRYMAPEQLMNEVLSPAADQYAFCVSLWEALVGRAPFPRKNRLLCKRRGPPPWPAAVPLPPRMAQAIIRGLHPDPALRWPAMETLLEQLQTTPARARAPLLVGGGALAMALGVAGWSVWRAERDRCTDSTQRLAGAWDPAKRSEVASAFAKLEHPLAPDTLQVIVPKVDAYASAWAAAHAEACEATRVRREQSAAVMDLRMACLQRRRQDLVAVARVLAGADDALVLRAHRLVTGLPSLAPCEDLVALRSEVPPPPPSELEVVSDVRAALADARAQTAAGRFSAAHDSIRWATSALEAVRYGPVQTEVALNRSYVLDERGRYEESEKAARAAMRSGLRWGQADLTLDASLLLTYVLDHRLARTEEAKVALLVAEGLVAQADRPRAWSRLHRTRGQVLQSQGLHTEAEAELRLALTQHELAAGPDDPGLIVLYTNLANLLRIQGRLAEAETQLRMALELREQHLGPDHPRVASILSQLGGVLQNRGQYEPAQRLLERGLSILERVHGRRHPDVANILLNLGNVYVGKEDLASAEAAYRRMLDIHLQVSGPDHPMVAIGAGSVGIALLEQDKASEAEPLLRQALAGFEARLKPGHQHIAAARGNLGRALLEQGRVREAEVELRAAREGFASALGAEHPEMVTAHDNVGRVLARRGLYAEAEREHRAAMVLGERVLGADHPKTLNARVHLADALLERGRPEGARPLLETIWASYDGDPPQSLDEARAAFSLARSLWPELSSRHRARTLAERARAFVERTEPADPMRDALSAWLRTHR